jgi:acetate kinase
VSRHVLCLNSGSSSVKFALYSMGEGDETLLGRGAVERIGLRGGSLWLRDIGKDSLSESEGIFFKDHAGAVSAAFGALDKLGLPAPDAVGHRIVHGGAEHTAPAVVDAVLLEKLRGLVPFAPLHLPGEIQGIEAVAARYPRLMQVACFDTAFHRGMPEAAQRFPLPNALWEEGVRRYGFHGLSYEYILGALGRGAAGRVIIAHLGNGASLAAVKDGGPVDTTMGLTPTGGLMMGTRSGDLDPGVLLYLMRERGYDLERLSQLVDHESGLLGVSGISRDMKTLLEKTDREPGAALAVQMFCRQLRKHIGAMAAVLGGLDTLVFTGGIGERAAPVRQDVCEGLLHLGIHLDAELNERHAGVVTSPGSPCTVRVIPTNEDLVIARHTNGLTDRGQVPR